MVRVLILPFALNLQRQELRTAFHAFDKNKTGKLDVGEMKYLLKSIGVCLTRREQRALEAGAGEIISKNSTSYNLPTLQKANLFYLSLEFRILWWSPSICSSAIWVVGFRINVFVFATVFKRWSFCVFALAAAAEFADRGEFDYEDLLTIGQVVYNDVAIENALVLALRKLTPKGAKTVPRTVLRDMLLNLGQLALLYVSPFMLFVCVGVLHVGSSGSIHFVAVILLFRPLLLFLICNFVRVYFQQAWELS